MKTEFLKGLGLEDDVIAKIQAESGKDVEAEKQKTKEATTQLETANTKIGEYEKQIGEFKKIDPNKLQEKINDLEKQIADRKKADDEAIKEKNYTERFEKATGEKKYLNDFTKKGIYEEFKTAITDAANSGKNDADIYGALIKDREGIFASENPGVDVPGVGSGDNTSKITDDQIRAVMGLPPSKK